MDARRVQLLRSPDGYHRVAVLARADGRFALARRWLPLPQHAPGEAVPPASPDGDEGPDATGADPWTSGLYATRADAEQAARQLLEQDRRETYGGMTVNERLGCAGLSDAFAAAADARDRAAMVAILAEVDVAAATADAILADPRRRGG